MKEPQLVRTTRRGLESSVVAGSVGSPSRLSIARIAFAAMSREVEELLSMAQAGVPHTSNCPGGRTIMGNWIPNDPTLVAQILKISAAYSPPPPEGFISPMTWGIESNVIERFAGEAQTLI